MKGGADPPGNVVPLRRKATWAQTRVRAIAADSANVLFTDHAQERMEARGFADFDVLRILRTGFVDDEPVAARGGEWKCKVLKKMSGERIAGVVTIIMVKDRLLVKTVEWEDGR